MTMPVYRGLTLAVAIAAMTAAMTVAITLAGCATEGGMGYSMDSFTYVSTPWQPKTITLKDMRTGQDFWSVDVPVGKKLVLAFSENEESKSAYTPDLMKWAICDDQEEYPSLGNSLAVPDKNARRLDMTIRAMPELPEGMKPRTTKAD